MAYDPQKGYVPLPPNQNLNIVDPQYKIECNSILRYLLEGPNTNRGIWFFENVTEAFPEISTTVLDWVIFPKLKIDEYISVINGSYAPSSTTRVQFRISDKGKVFISNGGYALTNPKNMKAFTFELLELLYENDARVNVVDFIVDFLQTNNIDKATIKFKIDDLVRDELITSKGHEFLAISGGHSRNEAPFIYASITQEGRKHFENLKEKKHNERALRTIQDAFQSKKTNNENEINSIQMTKDYTKVFIVHGHDIQAQSEVARFVEKLGFSSIILHEQANSGKTIIEKIEAFSNVGFGIVLYTPCDLGSVKGNENNLQKRARQNVIFEHGYLMGKIGRNNICALVKGDLELPNDLSGVVYTEMDNHSGWQMKLVKDMEASGYSIDRSKV